MRELTVTVPRHRTVSSSTVLVSLVAVNVVASHRRGHEAASVNGRCCRMLEAHLKIRPVRTLLFASPSVAVSCCVGVIPRTRLAEGGLTITVATGIGTTVIEDVPVFPSLVAVIVALPTARALTRPLADTLAIDGASDSHADCSPAQTLCWSLSFRPRAEGCSDDNVSPTEDSRLLPRLEAVPSARHYRSDHRSWPGSGRSLQRPR